MAKNKEKTRDFEKGDLPSNRVEVFFDSIKMRYSVIFKIGILLLLFSLPFLIASFFKDSYLLSIETSLNSEEITETQYNSYLLMATRIYCWVCIPCFALISLSLAGSIRIIKNLVWQDPIFFKQDFIDGIKANAMRYIVYSLFIGLIHYLSRMAILLNLNVPIISYLPSAISLGVFLPVVLFNFVQSQIYNISLLQEVKNGFLLYIRTFFTTFAATIIASAPIGFYFISFIYVKAVVEIIYVVFILPIVLLGELLYFFSKLDRFVNKEHHPEIYDKGIVRKSLNS